MNFSKISINIIAFLLTIVIFFTIIAEKKCEEKIQIEVYLTKNIKVK